MRTWPVILVLAALGVSGCSTPSPKTDNDVSNAAPFPVAAGSVNDVARYLAGLSGSRSGRLGDLRSSRKWTAHHNRMNQLWRYYDVGRLPEIRSFRESELNDLLSPDVLFYPFGGPDYLYAQAFFPGAKNYVLVGLENVDGLPDISALSDSQIEAGMDGISNSLKTLLGASYFVTKEMRVDLQSTSFRGVTPLILVMMARTGHRIESVKLIDLDSQGNITLRSGAGGFTPGVHVAARDASGVRRNVYYFQEDLSNNTIPRDKRLLSFISRHGSPVTFVKSASYLMHTDGFSAIRQEILGRSTAIVQGPSGIPFSYLDEGRWRMSLYGNYIRTLDIFREYFQPDLVAAYQSDRFPVKTISFGVGYQANPSTTCLIVARR